ncbi:MAG: chemotaxis protein CheR [bacterium]|nr:chemotaxis protein CheR [bacterium]
MKNISDLGQIYKQKLSMKDFNRLAHLIESQYGIKMPPVKKELLESRLRKRLKVLGFQNFSEYCDFLFTSEGMDTEIIYMVDAVTTNKTDFFRGPDHFDYLVKNVVPEMISYKGAGIKRDLMVWSAGCSTGEEPYTLAMVLSEFKMRMPGLELHYTILGTDLSTEVLGKAKKAIYHEDKAIQVPQSLKHKYLMRSKDRSSKLFRVVPELREHVKFRRLNFLNSDFGLREPMDIAFFRNVMIYFKRPVQKAILTKIISALRPGGYLFIGYSETLNGLDLPVVTVAPTIYRKPE